MTICILGLSNNHLQSNFLNCECSEDYNSSLLPVKILHEKNETKEEECNATMKTTKCQNSNNTNHICSSTDSNSICIIAISTIFVRFDLFCTRGSILGKAVKIKRNGIKLTSLSYMEKQNCTVLVCIQSSKKVSDFISNFIWTVFNAEIQIYRIDKILSENAPAPTILIVLVLFS